VCLFQELREVDTALLIVRAPPADVDTGVSSASVNGNTLF
jgi:hypothetical protein